MIKWKVKYYNGGLPLFVVTSEDMEWENLPKENVVEVDIIKDVNTHTLRGFDNYWLNNNTYGMFNNIGEIGSQEEDERSKLGFQEIKYEGEQYVNYEWADKHIRVYDDIYLKGTPTLSGVMIPDEDAKKIGLI